MTARHNLVSEATLAAFLSAQGMSLEALDAGQIPMPGGEAATRDTIEAAILASDPVSFCEAMLVERPDVGGGTWRMFHYQKPSMRWRGPTVHECAAGVGKTREIEGLIWHGGIMGRGGILVGSAEDGNLDVMREDFEFHLSQNPVLQRQVAKIEVKPYKKIVFKNGNIVYFRPAGHDGRAFRSIHVSQFGFFDEAAIPKNPVVFSEFYRALNPGAESREYSVPDGVRSSPFYKRCELAIPYAPGMEKPPDGRRVKFHWPRSLMPEPYWGPRAETEAIERFGGRDTPGYARNVHGLWGDPEDSVFPWSTFSPCLAYLPDYLVIKILWDGSTNTWYVEAHRLTKGYQIKAGSDVERADEETGVGPLTEVFKGDFPVGNFEVKQLLRDLCAVPENTPHLVAGVDIGGSMTEPSEILFSALRDQNELLTRVQMKNTKFNIQEDAIRALDSIYSPDHGWGIDAGGQGRVVEHNLRAGSGGFRFEDRLSGFVPNAKCEDFNPETGETRAPRPGESERRISYKELGTSAVERAMQLGKPRIPWDPDLIRDFTSYTATKGTTGERVYSQENDHTVTAYVMQMLRLLEIERGGLNRNTIPTIAVPEGAARMDLYSEMASQAQGRQWL